MANIHPLMIKSSAFKSCNGPVKKGVLYRVELWFLSCTHANRQ